MICKRCNPSLPQTVGAKARRPRTGRATPSPMLVSSARFKPGSQIQEGVDAARSGMTVFLADSGPFRGRPFQARYPPN